MVREKIVIIILLFIILGLTIVKIAVIEFLDQYDEQNYAMQQKIHAIEIQNGLLKNSLLYFESYTEIASEAATMGYH